MIKRFYFVVILAAFALPLFSAPPSLKTLSGDANLYSRAEHALKKHDYKNYQLLASKLQSYPLYPYLIYQELKQKIQEPKITSVTLQQLQDFQKSYPDFPFHQSLHNLWLNQVAKNQNWSALVEGYRPSKKAALECQYHFAKYQLSRNKHDLDPIKQLWLVGYSQAPECDKAFALWKKDGNFTPDLIWERFRLALENKNFTLISGLVKQMSPSDKEMALLMESLVKNPDLINQNEILKKLDQTTSSLKSNISMVEVLMIVLPLYASINADNAAHWLKANEQNYSFSKIQLNQLYKNIAIQLARQKSALANNWLANLPKDALDLTTQEWRVRVSLSQNDWQSTLKWINELPPYVKQEKCWRYWQARALEKLNQNQAAENIYKQLAQTRSYYGFLAAMHVKKPFVLQNIPIPPDPVATNEVLAMPAIKRFEQLLIVGHDHLARYEWFRALERMNDRQLNAAAKIAQKMNLPDYAIITTLKGSHRDDIPLRFPVVHHELILQNAEKNHIDPAWVFAIARQESSFFPGTLSEAGARGIMQLMPKTAAMISKNNKIPFQSDEALHDPSTSIQLGAIYLKDLQHKMYDNFILATAAYNAGPYRAIKWLPNETMDTDIWVENIPFNETREYVKNVFMFTGIYHKQLGLPTILESMIKPIPANVKKIEVNQ